MSAHIETGKQWMPAPATAGCQELQQHPEALDALRRKNVRAIVAEFEGAPPCSSGWEQVGKDGGFYFKPL
jgi:hypothetical protein